ncbi:hypothetical protein HMPREF0972_00256 [Actinomyces sp. oral taxon 848 str. F0332]|nr:hypothetical protein HMPREF0972_00256 [Actinomyces sp. oral taxon 848 str. F0332]
MSEPRSIDGLRLSPVGAIGRLPRGVPRSSPIGLLGLCSICG